VVEVYNFSYTKQHPVLHNFDKKTMETITHLKPIVEFGKIQTFIAKQTELDKVYKLRYLAYLSNNSIESNPDKSFSDKYDSYSSSINHIAVAESKIIGSIRGCFYDPANPHKGLPSFEVFKSEIEKEIGLNDTIFESCRFVIEPGQKKYFKPILH